MLFSEIVLIYIKDNANCEMTINVWNERWCSKMLYLCCRLSSCRYLLAVECWSCLSWKTNGLNWWDNCQVTMLYFVCPGYGDQSYGGGPMRGSGGYSQRGSGPYGSGTWIYSCLCNRSFFHFCCSGIENTSKLTRTSQISDVCVQRYQICMIHQQYSSDQNCQFC